MGIIGIGIFLTVTAGLSAVALGALTALGVLAAGVVVYSISNIMSGEKTSDQGFKEHSEKTYTEIRQMEKSFGQILPGGETAKKFFRMLISHLSILQYISPTGT